MIKLITILLFLIGTLHAFGQKAILLERQGSLRTDKFFVGEDHAEAVVGVQNQIADLFVNVVAHHKGGEARIDVEVGAGGRQSLAIG